MGASRWAKPPMPSVVAERDDVEIDRRETEELAYLIARDDWLNAHAPNLGHREPSHECRLLVPGTAYGDEVHFDELDERGLVCGARWLSRCRCAFGAASEVISAVVGAEVEADWVGAVVKALEGERAGPGGPVARTSRSGRGTGSWSTSLSGEQGVHPALGARLVSDGRSAGHRGKSPAGTAGRLSGHRGLSWLLPEDGQGTCRPVGRRCHRPLGRERPGRVVYPLLTHWARPPEAPGRYGIGFGVNRASWLPPYCE